MMASLGQHAAFIVGAYAIAVVVIGALIVWIMLDRRALTRDLAELDARGITRRSARAE